MLGRLFGFSQPPPSDASDVDEDFYEFSESEAETEREKAITSSVVDSSESRPLLFVSCDSQGKFRLEKEACDVLSKLQGPVGVLAVCGRSRQGKSFILNQLLGRSSGFKVAPSSRPCTKGLWIWSNPLAYKQRNGKNFNLILLDTEGIEATDQTNKYSTQIFSLAILLSSVFVFNQLGAIDESSLNALSLVTKMVENIRVKANSRSSLDDLSKFTPHFIWLLRDFYLDLRSDNLTPNKYLENALKPTSGNSLDVKEKNEIRNSIKSLFPNRDCFTLVRPIQDEALLRKLDSLPPEKLRKEFRDELNSFCELAFSKAKPKSMGSIKLSGPMFVSLTQSYLDALNRNAVPTIASSWKNVEELECKRAIDSGIVEFERTFDKTIGSDEGLLNTEFLRAMEYARTTFDEICIASGERKIQFEEKLIAECTKIFEGFKSKIFVEAENICRSRLMDMQTELLNESKNPNMTVNQLFKVLEQKLLAYDQTVKGNIKWKLFLSFLCNNLGSIFSEFTNRKVEAVQSGMKWMEVKVDNLTKQTESQSSEIADKKSQILNLKNRYDMLELDLSRAKSQSIEASAKYQQTLYALQGKLSESENQAKKAMEEASQWKAKFVKADSEKQGFLSEYQVRESRLIQKLNTFEKEADLWKSKFNSRESEYQARLQEESKRYSEMSSKAASNAQECSTLKRSYEELQSKFANADREAFLKISDLDRQLRDAKLEVAHSQDQIRNLQSLVDSVKSLEKEKLDSASQQLNSITNERDKWMKAYEVLEEDLKSTKSELTHQLLDLNQRLESADSSASQWKKNCDDLRAELNKKGLDVSSKELEWKEKNRHLTERSNELALKLDLTEKESTKLKDKILQLELQVQSITTDTSQKLSEQNLETQNLQKECALWKGKHETQRKEFSELHQLSTQEKRLLQSEIDRQKVSIENLRAEIDLFNSEKNKWALEKKEFEVRLGGELKEKEKHQIRCSELQARVQKLDEKFSAVSERLNFYEKEAAELKISLKNEKENGIAVLQKKELEIRIQHMERDLKDVESRLDSANMAVEEKNKLLVQFQLSLNQESKRLQDAKSLCEKSHVTKDHLQKLEFQLKESIEKHWQMKLDEIEKEKSSLSEKLIMSQGDNAILKRKLDEACEKLQQSEVEKAKLTGKRALVSMEEETPVRSKRLRKSDQKDEPDQNERKDKRIEKSSDDYSFGSSDVYPIIEGEASVDEEREAIPVASSSRKIADSGKRTKSAPSTPKSQRGRKKSFSVVSAGIDPDDPFNKKTKTELKQLLVDNNRVSELYEELQKHGDHKAVCINLCKKFDIKLPK